MVLRYGFLPLGFFLIFTASVFLGEWIALLVFPWVILLDYLDDKLTCPSCGKRIHGVYRVFNFELKSPSTPRHCSRCQQDLEQVPFRWKSLFK